MKRDHKQQSNVAGPGNSDKIARNAHFGAELKPDFRFALDSDTSFFIEPDYRLMGHKNIRIPYTTIDALRDASGYSYYLRQTPWELDLTRLTIDTAIDLDNDIGGLVSEDTALVSNRQYLIWAFFKYYDTGAAFQGIGFTPRPQIIGATLPGALGFGATGDVDLPSAGDGWRFTDGCKIVLMRSTNLGNDYNQATVNSRTSTGLNITTDASYGATVESNTSLPAETSLLVIQLDKFEPKIITEDSAYPGDTFGDSEEYSFSYLGSFHTTFNGKYRSPRKRGELITLPVGFPIYLKAGIVGTTNEDVCLAKFMPLDTKFVNLQLQAKRTAGAGSGGYLSAGIDAINPKQAITSMIIDDNLTYGNGLVSVEHQKTTVNMQSVPPAASTIQSEAFLTSYIEDET
jgi:hypothetical protein